MGLALDEPNEEDKVFEQEEGFTVVVNAQELENIGDVEVDFKDSRFGSGFTVRATHGSTCS